MHAQGYIAMNHRSSSVCYVVLIDPDGDLNAVVASGIAVEDPVNVLEWAVVGRPQTNTLGTRMKLKLRCIRGHRVKKKKVGKHVFDTPPDAGTITVTLPDGTTSPAPTVNVPVVYVNDTP